MWSWSLGWSEITSRVIIGSCPMSGPDIARIQAELDVTAILSLQHDECLSHFGIDYQEHVSLGERLGLVMVRCPIRDFDTLDMRRRLPEAVVALGCLVASGHRVYAHCTAGLGRSPLVALSYLTFLEGFAPAHAYELIRERRPDAAPDWEAYNGCYRDLIDRCRDAIASRAWDLHQQGVNRDALRDWHQAELDVIRKHLRIKAWDSSQPRRLASVRSRRPEGAVSAAGGGTGDAPLEAMQKLLVGLDRLQALMNASGDEARSAVHVDMQHLEGLVQTMSSTADQGQPHLYLLSARNVA